MMKNLKRFFVLPVAAALLLSVMPVSAADSEYYTDDESCHSTLDFSEMEITDYSLDEALAVIDELTAAIEVSDNEEAVLTCYENMLDMVDKATTASSIADIHYYADVMDDDAAELSEELTSDLTTIFDAADVAVSAMLDTEYEHIVIDDIGTEGADSFRDYEAMTDEEIALAEEETELEQEYDELVVSDYDDEEEWYSGLCEIYIKLVENRKKQAELAGYDTYMEYCYENVYMRDYSVSESEEYREAVKTCMLDLLNDIIYAIQDGDLYTKLEELESPSPDDILDAMEEHLPEISEELMPAFNALKDQELCDIGEGENKMDMGYTTNLYSYNVPFIFNTPYDNFYDYTCMFHEFGHFNHMYHSPSRALYDSQSYDVAEIQSQGLELLFLEYADDIYGEGMKEADTLYELYSMVSSVLDGCLFDEFQQRAFEEEDLTEEKLTELYTEISESYGYTDMDTGYMWWVQVNHNFESPFYYVSYSTSALAALEIYSDSLTDRDAAIEEYLRISSADDSLEFREALEYAGLDDVMEESTISEIASTIETKCLGNENGSPTAKLTQIGATAVLVAIPVIWLVLNGIAILVVLLIDRKIRKKTK